MRIAANKPTSADIAKLALAESILADHHGSALPLPASRGAMAPPKPNGKQQSIPIHCLRPTCTGSIPLGVLVHKHSIGIKPCCRVCQQLGQTRKFVIPPGAERDPLAYARNGRASQERQANGRSGGRSDGGTHQPDAKLRGHLAATESRLKHLESLLKAHNVDLPMEAQSSSNASSEELSTLKSHLQGLQKLGIECPDLEEKIRAAELALQGKQDLKAVLGKLNAAEAHAKQCTENYAKLEDQLAAAKEKSKEAIRKVAELCRQRDQLLADKGYAKSTEAG